MDETDLSRLEERVSEQGLALATLSAQMKSVLAQLERLEKKGDLVMETKGEVKGMSDQIQATRKTLDLLLLQLAAQRPDRLSPPPDQSRPSRAE